MLSLIFAAFLNVAFFSAARPAHPDNYPAKTSLRDSCDMVPALNARVIEYVNEHMGRKVKSGQCWDLAAEALNHAGAQWDGLYRYGRRIDLLNECIYQGDIVQFEGVEVRYLRNGMEWMESMSHHTAIIYKVNDDATWELAHQNFGRQKKKVGVTSLDMRNITKGTFSVWRPVNQ